MKVNWAKLVSDQDVRLTTPPATPFTGLLLGNGDIGVSVYGKPECITLHVGKNDIWDYRDGVYELLKTLKPLTQKDLVDYYTDPNAPRDPEADSGPHPTLSAFRAAAGNGTHMPKPAGQIRFRNAGLAGADYGQDLRLWDAEVAGTFGTPALAQIRTFVSHKRSLVVTQYSPKSLQTFDIELARHIDSLGCMAGPPEFGANGRDIWAHVRFKADSSSYAFKDGFEYVIYGRIIGGEVQSEIQDGQVVAHVESSKPVMLLVAVVTSRDDKCPFDRAKAEVSNGENLDFARLGAEHREGWHKFWQRSFVHLPDNPYLTQLWFLNNYHLACCSREGKVMPGLCGNWSYLDAAAWSGSYTWNYNVEEMYWGAYSSNHIDLTIPYNDMIFSLLPAAKAEARDIYGIGGAKYFHVTYPYVNYNPNPFTGWDRAMSLSAWVSQGMWLYYQYSQDVKYLRDKAYPVMRDCAQFYEEYLQLAPDGKYDIVPTVSPEHWGFTHMLTRNKNCILDLAMIKYLMSSCIEASEKLGIDADKRPLWRKIAVNLRDYPKTNTPDGEVFVDVESAPVIAYNLPVPTMAIFPGCDIGLHSPEPVREIALRTLKSLSADSYWTNLKSVYISKARLGLDALDEYEAFSRKYAQPNGVEVNTIGQNHPAIYAGSFNGPAVINENIIQSYTGQIHVAPVNLQQTAQFAHLRAVGAFLVSGEILPGGKVSYITITSEAGGDCSVVLPWPTDARVRELSSLKEVATRAVRNTISFGTVKGRTYVIDTLESPWESVPERTIH